MRPSVRRALVTLALTAPIFGWSLAPRPVAAQISEQEVPGVRIVEFGATPEPAQFGEPFRLDVHLRIPPGIELALPDTLVPTDGAASAGAGSWTEEPGPGDSLDVHATYPVLPFRSGRVELPWLPLEFGPGRAAGGAGPDLDLLVPIGAVEVDVLSELDQVEGELRPRPPADVLGENVSGWAVAAIGLLIAGTGGLAWTVVARWRAAGPGASEDTPAPMPPRRRALEELERLSAEGLLEAGQVREFYKGVSNVLREYAAHVRPEWSDALTATELLERINGHWGEAASDPLTGPLSTGERVKFGRLRPELSVAEEDRVAVRDWILRFPVAS